MKLHRLEIAGFGPFLRRQVIDFDDYDADGLFLISGKTGAGKSSILDAVCFALYASVPRYATNGGKRVRSDHAGNDDISEVSLTFTAADTTYRVTRSPEYAQAKKRGTGTTTKAATVLLERLENGQWVGIAARAVDAGHKLDEILQLNKDQFLQVILLAQNRFARFLLADSKERQALLRTLFGTRRFEQYQTALAERRKGSEQRMATGLSRVEERILGAERILAAGAWNHASAPDATGFADTSDEPADVSDTPEVEAAVTTGSGVIESALMTTIERLERLVQQIEVGAQFARVLADKVDAADAVRISRATRLDQVRAERDKQLRRDVARVSVASLNEQASEIEKQRGVLISARAANTLISVLDAHERAAHAVVGSLDVVNAAATQWRANTHPTLNTDDTELPCPEALRTRASELTATLGGWKAVLATEAQLDELALAHDKATRDWRVAVEDLDKMREEAKQIPAQLVAAEAHIAELMAKAALAPQLETQVSELSAQLAAALKIEGAEQARDAALLAAAEASSRSAVAASHLESLYRRKLAGSASELAATLEPSCPCPVCGSPEHPEPAPENDDLVTQDDLDAATADRDAKSQVASAASDEVRKTGEIVAGLNVATGGRSLEDVRDAESTARDEHAQATQAQQAVDSETAARDALRARGDAIAQDMAVAAEAITATATIKDIAHERQLTAQTTVAAARGEFETVAKRAAQVEAEREAAEALRAAQEDAARLVVSETEAKDARDRALEESVFATGQQARDAMLAGSSIEAIDKQISEHDSSLKAAKMTLADLDNGTLAEEPVDVAAAQLSAESASQTWAQLKSDVVSVNEAVKSLTDQTASAREAHQSQSAALAEHETIVRLADSVSGREPNTKKMSLETFVLAAELEEIVKAANVRLAEISSGRYRLQHSDERMGNSASGLGIDIFDTFTSKARPAQSLSGGETFLASLSLALGLAEVVTSRAGGVRLDTLFIDEGFGSLDADTLERAMQTLDELRAGGRTVGLISHVEAMKEQIPAQVRVYVAADGSSEISDR